MVTRFAKTPHEELQFGTSRNHKLIHAHNTVFLAREANLLFLLRRTGAIASSQLSNRVQVHTSSRGISEINFVDFTSSKIATAGASLHWRETKPQLQVVMPY